MTTTKSTGHGAMREAFEAFLPTVFGVTNPGPIHRVQDGSYFYAHVNIGWACWQAALSSAAGGAGVLTDAEIMGIAFDQRFVEGSQYIISIVRKAILAATQRAEPVAQSGVEGRFALLRALADEVRASGRPMIADELEAIAALNAAPPAAAERVTDWPGHMVSMVANPEPDAAIKAPPAVEAEPVAWTYELATRVDVDAMPSPSPQPTDEETDAGLDFEQAARPLIKWLSENVHPHHTAIVTNDSAELLEGTQTVRTNEYIKD